MQRTVDQESGRVELWTRQVYKHPTYPRRDEDPDFSNAFLHFTSYAVCMTYTIWRYDAIWKVRGTPGHSAATHVRVKPTAIITFTNVFSLKDMTHRTCLHGQMFGTLWIIFPSVCH